MVKDVIAKQDPISPEFVLAEEADAIHGRDPRAPQKPSSADWTLEETRALYQRLNALNRFALCLSGGGIRSASFALGILQALATHPRQKDDSPVETPETSLLSSFHYLSTVSGGGYIGSWLSLWIQRARFPAVWRALVGRPGGPDHEPHPIGWLRENSNYLTAKVGLTSGDFWAALALYFRNLFLNWFVLVPWLAGALVLLKIYAALSAAFWRLDGAAAQPYVAIVAGTGIVALQASLRFAVRHRPSRLCEPVTQRQFLRWSFPAAILAAMCLSLCVTSNLMPSPLQQGGWAAGEWAYDWLRKFAKASPCASMMAAGGFVCLFIYAFSWIVEWPVRRPDYSIGFEGSRQNFRDFACWSVSGIAYGAAMGLGAYLYFQTSGDVAKLVGLESVACAPLLLVLVFGVSWGLYSQIFAEMIFVGISSYAKDSDEDREWLARSSGLLTAVALLWPVVMFLALVGSSIAMDLWEKLQVYLGPIGGATGLITLLAGGSSRSPANGAAKTLKGLSMTVILAIAAPLFAAALIVLLSALIDKIALEGSLLKTTALMSAAGDVVAAKLTREWQELIGALAVLVVVGFIASKSVNINRFSLHSLYRNRLIRAYLGASNVKRDVDPFTNFAIADNVWMYSLWPTQIGDGVWPKASRAEWRPFHVINMALNIVSTKRLAWQERKAESFTVSPLHSGSRCLAYRSSAMYGGEDGITLGTAMAISGAAASPNMGYHSSSGITFLLALFNVRLGWWLGNPGENGAETFHLDGPRFAAGPLFSEAFGLTTDDNPFVYLSDGGHFEDLALYEMVRRRCRFIVVSDADADPQFAFEDLGNAVRKISIDLGVSITFHNVEALKKRPTGKHAVDIGEDAPYYAVGEIDYKTADGGASENGIVLYVKPGYHGVESAGIRSYAIAHPDFPHETTANQWFSESQLESYRALGFEIMDGILKKGSDKLPAPSTLDTILQSLLDSALQQKSTAGR